MDIIELINHPEKMDRETLYELRSLLALYPYYQTARLLMLQNLYLLHDPAFDEELRRAALYVSNRQVLFNIIEAAHYKLRIETKSAKREMIDKTVTKDRTTSLIDSFLQQIPIEKEDANNKNEKRKPTPADAAVDYVAYLLQEEEDENNMDMPQMRGGNLIDEFIHRGNGTFDLRDTPEYLPETDASNDNKTLGEDETYFTETLAQIYVKQGRYQKALDIIKRINTNNVQRNKHLEDQVRYLQKLIMIQETQPNS